MSIMVEATYENGVLRPHEPLPLKDRETVRIHVLTVADAVRRVRETAGLIPCSDALLVEWAAMDPDLEFPSPEAP